MRQTLLSNVSEDEETKARELSVACVLVCYVS